MTTGPETPGAPPQLYGYTLEQRVGGGPLAEIWQGRSLTGDAITALVLTAAGAADARVTTALRDSAYTIVSDQRTSGLLATNFDGDRPYVITDREPGKAGAELLLPRLESATAVGNVASGGPQPTTPATAAQEPPGGAGPVRAPTRVRSASARLWGGSGSGRRISSGAGKTALGLLFLVLVIGSAGYSAGKGIRGRVAPPGPPVTTSAAPAPASPSALPTRVLLSAPPTLPVPSYRRNAPAVAVAGTSFRPGDDTETLATANLPFAFRVPKSAREWTTVILGASSTTTYRRFVDGNPGFAGSGKVANSLDVWVAVSPCAPAQCASRRSAFDAQVNARLKDSTPTKAVRANTWYATSTDRRTYERIWQPAGSSTAYLIRVMINSADDAGTMADQIMNDIASQTA